MASYRGKGAAPLGGAEEEAAHAISACSVNGECKLDYTKKFEVVPPSTHGRSGGGAPPTKGGQLAPGRPLLV